MKKLILLFAVLAFVACGKDEPEQPKNLNLYNPDKKVILHTVADYKVQNKALLRSNGVNIADVIKRTDLNIFKGLAFENSGWNTNEEFLNGKNLVLETKTVEERVVSSLSSYNFDTINNKIIFPIDEAFSTDGTIKERLLGAAEWVLFGGNEYEKVDTLAYVPLPNLWENQIKIKEFLRNQQYDSIYNILENEFKIVWVFGNGKLYKDHINETLVAYPDIVFYKNRPYWEY